MPVMCPLMEAVNATCMQQPIIMQTVAEFGHWTVARPIVESIWERKSLQETLAREFRGLNRLAFSVSCPNLSN